MNKVLALGQLGFEENYDYTATVVGNQQKIEWLSETPEPGVPEMQVVLDELALWNPVKTLADFQEEAKQEIDQTAEQMHQNLLSAGPGQMLVYQEKLLDARAHKAAGYPAGLSLYPWIRAEVDAIGITAQAASDQIINRHDEWVTVGTEIEKNRRFWKLEVGKATDEDGVEFNKGRAKQILKAL